MAKNKKRRQLETKRRKFETKEQKKSSFKSESQMGFDSNPFEFHRNKVKYEIIGRKLAKNEFGNKGLSRNKAFNKRKNTILEEYKQKHKSGKGLQDLRNKDNKTTNTSKRLNESIDLSFSDDLVLTHKGKQLSDAIDDTIGSDDEDIDLFNRPEFVESSHFGGGSDGRPKSANEVLNQIMDEKREKQMERVANIELTDKLDSEWNQIKNILRHKGVKSDSKDNTKEDFDILVKELMFDTKTKPIIDVKVQTIAQQTSDKRVETESIESVKKSAETLFKEQMESIQKLKNWSEILDLIKMTTNDLLPQISEESLSVFTEKYQTMTQMKSGLNANNFAFLLFGTHFKQSKLMVRIVLTQMLAKNKYNSFNEIAIALVVIKILLITCDGKYIPEVFNAINNIIHLTQSQELVELTVGQKQKSKLKCILALNAETGLKKSIDFDIKYIFDENFKNLDILNENQIKSMLFLEALKRVEDIYEIYSNIHSFTELITPLKSICSQLSNDCFPEDIKEVMSRLTTKLNREAPKAALSESRPKPFMLPMFEPKFDDNPNNNKKNTKKRLVKKYNRELKGAQREIRKDWTFMRSTWISEIKANDEHRKRKVKELMGDLAQQQGLYKKKKK